MVDRKILLEKMSQFGIDWIGSSGFLDEGQVNHVLDIVERESGIASKTKLEKAVAYIVVITSMACMLSFVALWAITYL